MPLFDFTVKVVLILFEGWGRWGHNTSPSLYFFVVSLLLGSDNTFVITQHWHTKQERNMIVLPSYQYSVIVGLLLSDGWLIIPSATNISPRLGLSQSLSHFKYVWFVFNALSHYCDNFPVLRERKRGTKTLWCVDVVTGALPCFSEIYSLFYVNKIKVIPHNIYELFTPVVFAHLIMGDGGFKSKGIFLCADSYSIQDVVRLMNVLIIRYDLKCTLHKSYENYRIYISRNSSYFFSFFLINKLTFY